MTNNVFQVKPELPAWLWTLPPKSLLAVLDAHGGQFGFGQIWSIKDYFWVQLREMALHLIVEAPTGPAADATEFLSRFDPFTLAKLWGGQPGVTPWAGAPGVDQQIAALLEGKQPVLPCLLAEFTNRFRYWAAFPEQLREAVLDIDPDFSFESLDS